MLSYHFWSPENLLVFLIYLKYLKGGLGVKKWGTFNQGKKTSPTIFGLTGTREDLDERIGSLKSNHRYKCSAVMLSSLSLKSYHHIIVFNFVKNPFWQNPNGFTETSNGIDINSCSAPLILILIHSLKGHFYWRRLWQQ